MNKYTTVRIDNNTMAKLENIVQLLQKNNIGKVSKAAAIKYVIDKEYEKTIACEEQEKYTTNI